jgi:hypothetical protein
MEYFENLYSNKVENWEEIDKFLESIDLPKLNKENINHLNISTKSNEIEAVIVNQQRRTQDPMDSLPSCFTEALT